MCIIYFKIKILEFTNRVFFDCIKEETIEFLFFKNKSLFTSHFLCFLI